MVSHVALPVTACTACYSILRTLAGNVTCTNLFAMKRRKFRSLQMHLSREKPLHCEKESYWKPTWLRKESSSLIGCTVLGM